jgi:hypothetical protein
MLVGFVCQKFAEWWFVLAAGFLLSIRPRRPGPGSSCSSLKSSPGPSLHVLCEVALFIYGASQADTAVKVHFLIQGLANHAVRSAVAPAGGVTISSLRMRNPACRYRHAGSAINHADHEPTDIATAKRVQHKST